MSAEPVYDRLGVGYTATRRPDPRIAARIADALSGVESVVNVGAGTGSYEPSTTVLAVEPSAVMIAQRPPAAAPAIQACAEALPLPDGFADGATAILTLHHWDDWAAGLAELRRVARRRVVIFTFDPSPEHGFWLTREYLPEIDVFHRARFPPIDRIAELLGGARVEPVPVPYDCRDGFLGAFWRRPWAYLDPAVQAGISPFRLFGEALAAGVERLAADLESGAWHERHAGLMGLGELDIGYRLVVSDAA